MDPNKDFIHIDDVFKNLRNGEEREGSGAWLNMKGLLDAEMPVGGVVSGGRSVRRYIIPAVALLLLGGGAAYWKVTGDKKADAVLTEATQPAGTLNTSTGGNNPYSGNSKNDRATTLAATTPATHSGKAKATHGGQQQAGPGTQTGGAASQATGRSHAGGTPAASATHATAGTAARKNGAVADNRDQTASRNKTRQAKPTHQTVASHTGAPAGNNGSNTPASGNQANTIAAVKPTVVKQQQVLETIKHQDNNTNNSNNSNNNNNNNTSTALASATGDKGATAAGDNTNTTNSAGNTNNSATPWTWKTKAIVNNKKIVQSPDGNYYKEQRDTFKRIDLVERYVYPHGKAARNTAPKLITDTVAVTRIENIRYVPLTKIDIAELKKLNVNITVRELVPLAKLRAGTVAREHVNLVPLSNYKVASRSVDPSSFNKLIQNTAGGVAGYFDGSRNFYAAVMVGGNGSFGNPGAFGMQIGVAGLLALSERWTLVAELKYMNHYFSNYNLQDQSVSYEVSKTQNGAGWLFSGKELVNTSSYKVNSYGSIHMPVTMSYNLGRVSVFGGLDLAYAFPISWEKRTSTNTNFVESQVDQDKNPYQNKFGQLDEVHDFGSRFGLGYAMGMSYDFSRKLSVDARMTQILFDNAKGGTEGINKLFRQPSLQLSLGYYFGRKEKVVYIMDRR
ncbi:outer membrane beta-barrel protein [Taibaiella chishuiensis]|uniref:Outer membrane protein with beta-barrel domain n=1 Tax=Taibaiella chishuiensis TaxID=1434707 RepID=A0A2P8CYM8_9BACT|nr:outer membrane beta-barrel protein [Taibaiella chishuiensis]PSK90071.1 outer membrane protein with beta-barrel domain [Taibaiella chishuiensis]